MGKLNERTIKALPPRDRVYREGDGEGLFLEVRPNGSKLWIYKYAFPRAEGDGVKSTACSLGTWPRVRAKRARLARDRARDQVAAGLEPARVRAEERARNVKAQAEAKLAAERARAGTVYAVAEAWFETRSASAPHHDEGLCNSPSPSS